MFAANSLSAAAMGLLGLLGTKGTIPSELISPLPLPSPPERNKLANLARRPSGGRTPAGTTHAGNLY